MAHANSDGELAGQESPLEEVTQGPEAREEKRRTGFQAEGAVGKRPRLIQESLESGVLEAFGGAGTSICSEEAARAEAGSRLEKQAGDGACVCPGKEPSIS